MTAMRVLVAVSALVGLAVATGCGGGGGGSTPTQATVQGTLRHDATLAAVPGATVTIGTTSTTSASNGTFSLATAAGQRTVTISATGFVQTVLNESIVEGVNNLGVIYLQPQPLSGRGAVRGAVRHEGSAEAGALVRSGDAQAVSKADGQYALYNLTTGERAITAVSADGLATGHVVVTVQPNSTIAGADITLDDAPPPPPSL